MSGPVSANEQFFWRPRSFLAGRAAFPIAGAGQAGSYAFAESDSFLLRDRGENGNDRIFEDPAGIEVRLGEAAIADAGPSQSVEMSEGFKDAFAVKRSRDQNKSRSKRRRAASRNISWNSMRSRLAPDSRSAYSQEIVQPCFAANSRSCASRFSTSWPLSRVLTRP